MSIILGWADAFHARVGHWPTSGSGPVAEIPGETWFRINSALIYGSRGLSGGSSLSRLLACDRGVRYLRGRPPLAVSEIVRWADLYHKSHGTWPESASGPIPEAPGETWKRIQVALERGIRGLPGGSSLKRLLWEQRGVPYGLAEFHLPWTASLRGPTRASHADRSVADLQNRSDRRRPGCRLADCGHRVEGRRPRPPRRLEPRALARRATRGPASIPLAGIDDQGSSANQVVIVRKSKVPRSSSSEAMVAVLRVLCTTIWEAAPNAGSRELAHELTFGSELDQFTRLIHVGTHRVVVGREQVAARCQGQADRPAEVRRSW